MCKSLLTLLLVEDHQEQSFLIQEFLAETEGIDWKVTEVERLSKALEILQAHRFDAIVLDLSLPDSSGLQTLGAVKAIAPQTPIVVLTVLNSRDLALEAISQGAQDFLIKGKFQRELLSLAINYAIKRQRIQEELQVQIERERLMARMVERIRQSLDLDTILRATVEEVRKFLCTDQVLIYRCEPDDQGAIVAESLGEHYEEQRNQHIQKLLDYISQFSSSIAFNPHQTPPIFSVLEDNQWIDSMVHSLLTVPIWQSSETQKHHLWGQLIAYDYGGNRRWQEWEVEFLTQLGNNMAIALKQAELYQQVARLAHQDGLTGLANRRLLDGTLEQEWKRLVREKSPLSLVMCDVDFFGKYNNAKGYLEGDDCLKTIAEILKNACQRSADLAARFGGEEFLLILPNTNANGALTVAKKVQQSLISHQLPHPKSSVSSWVTLSIGVTTEIPQSSQTAMMLLDRVAQAVQQAKREGRNRIVQV
ncbi:MAG: diguanylate cyclase [Microcystaceae cyanobacterium]